MKRISRDCRGRPGPAGRATAAQARSFDAIQKDGTLRLATEGYYAPFAYFEGKKLTGFEVDLAELTWPRRWA